MDKTEGYDVEEANTPRSGSPYRALGVTWC